ncbi:hypothetical protein B484DRAFT_458115 [Ochromonadaceae sp. CCMP2298]|nr:hypothetical protein B484DRAFT_458115 [Ochromonadaceae sp. CCMP2298]
MNSATHYNDSAFKYLTLSDIGTHIYAPVLLHTYIYSLNTHIHTPTQLLHSYPY